MRWTISKSFPFEASHQLHGHDGPCRNLHGHSWTLKVFIAGQSLEDAGPKEGMVMDYGDVSSVVRPLIRDYLDHHHLNDSLGIDRPTSEWVAQWVYRCLKPKISDLVAVEIWETATSCCRYEEGQGAMAG